MNDRAVMPLDFLMNTCNSFVDLASQTTMRSNAALANMLPFLLYATELTGEVKPPNLFRSNAVSTFHSSRLFPEAESRELSSPLKAIDDAPFAPGIARS